MTGITKGMIADIRRRPEIRLPKDYFSNAEISDMRAAMVIHFERSGELRLFPMTKESGARIRLEVEKVNPALMQTMTSLFKQYDLKVLFTTGFCFEQNRCVYEVYFAADNMAEKEKNIRRAIESIPGLYTCEFEILKVDGDW
ncbi:MAG: hypothetical protein QXS20_06450 [Candidatus Thorarchaeota archaeon]